MGATRLADTLYQERRCTNPNCGALMEPDAEYCIVCGCKYEEQATMTGICACGNVLNDGDVFCTACGRPVRPGYAFYDNCGPVRPELSAPPEPVGQCTCGEPYFQGDRFCQKCGKELVPDASAFDWHAGRNTILVDGDGGGEKRPVPNREPKRRTQPASNPNVTWQTHADFLDDDEPLLRSQLVWIRDEVALNGGPIRVETDLGEITIDVPPGVDSVTQAYVEGFGYFDQGTGRRGRLCLSFSIEEE